MGAAGTGAVPLIEPIRPSSARGDPEKLVVRDMPPPPPGDAAAAAAAPAGVGLAADPDPAKEPRELVKDVLPRLPVVTAGGGALGGGSGPRPIRLTFLSSGCCPVGDPDDSSIDEL